MKDCSDQFKRLLAQANRDEQFAAKLLADPSQASYWYDLQEAELERLATYQGREDIARDFAYCHKLNGGFELLNRRFPVNKFSTGDFHQARYSGAVLIIVLLLGYLVLSNVLDIGLPPFQALKPTTRLGIVLFVFGYFLFNFSFVGRELTDLQTSERIALITATIVLIVVPAVIVLRSQEEGIQGIFLRLVLAIFFTSLPASFFVLFILNKRKTIWEEFVDNLKRLDPIEHRKLAQIYHKKFIAIYGDPNQGIQNSDLLGGETSFPVYLCTFIIAIGWLLFFFPAATTVKDFPYGFTRVDDIVASPFTFGFLGAYFFILQMLFRRYVQSDLKPTAYSQASKRLLSTWVWAFVLFAIADFSETQPGEGPTPIYAILAFVIGVFPEIGWQVISNTLKAGLGLMMPSFRQTHPLDKIDGITVWVNARLLEEDIENVQNLVTVNIFDLMLRTNLHPRRIVNWIDQGILLLHTSDERAKEVGQNLRAYGIITASDLIFSYQAFKAAGRDCFIDDKTDDIIERMLEAIKKDPNMYHVLAWHKTRGTLSVDSFLERETSLSVDGQKQQAEDAS